MTQLVLGQFLAYPLHPLPWRRPAGSRDYRVTNGYDGPDYVNGGKHRAVDVGNFRVDDPIRSPITGRARGRRHYDGALGLEFDLGGGVVLELWHLNATLPYPHVPRTSTYGDWQAVRAGAVVGATGATGAPLSDGKGGTVPMPAHTHARLSRAGVPFDPEPHLFGAPITILEDDDVKIPAGLAHLAQGVVGAGNRLRRDPRTTEGSRVLDGAVYVQVYGVGVPGEQYTLGGRTSDRYAWVGVYGESWHVAEPLLADVVLTPAGRQLIPQPVADCSAVELELDRARARIARARTAVSGASQALGPALEALK